MWKYELLDTVLPTLAQFFQKNQCERFIFSIFLKCNVIYFYRGKDMPQLLFQLLNKMDKLRGKSTPISPQTYVAILSAPLIATHVEIIKQKIADIVFLIYYLIIYNNYQG